MRLKPCDISFLEILYPYMVMHCGPCNIFYRDDIAWREIVREDEGMILLSGGTGTPS